MRSRAQRRSACSIPLNHPGDPPPPPPKPRPRSGTLRDSAGFYRALPTPHVEEGKVAVQSTPPTQVPAGYDRYADDDDRGYGWVMFAGVLLMMLGTLNFIEGLAAIGNAHFFTANAHYIAGSLNTWGWVVLCIGVARVGRRCWRVRQEPVLAVGRSDRPGTERDRAADDDPRPSWSLSIFTLDILATDRLDRVRQADLQADSTTRNRLAANS